MRRLSLMVSVLFLGLSLSAQSKNIFLDRTYWKSNPSIEDIIQKISEGNNVTQLNANAFDAVCYAFLENVDNTTIKYLLSKEGNGVNKITHDGRTYIFWAAYKGNLEMVQFLLDQGARMDVVDSHGYTVMNFAASTGQVTTALFDLLLANGASIKDVDHNGANVLLLSGPYLKDTSLIDYFTSKGLNSTSTDTDGNGLFNYAARGGNLPFMQQLINEGYNYKQLNKHGGNAVMFATRGTRGRTNGLDVYKFLKSMDIDINVIGKEGRNPLHMISSREEDQKLYQFFIANGVKVDLADDNGNTPFMWAARSNSLETIQFLIPYVKNINHANKDGQSALTMAINRNTPEVSQFLIKKGASVDIKDKDGNSLAYYLINSFRANQVDAFEAKLELLEAYGFTISPTEAKGQTLYHLAVEKNDLELVKRLKEFDLDINAKNKSGLTALHLAAMKARNHEIMKYLIDNGADKGILTDFDESVYDLASENELLINENVDLTFLK